MKVFLVLITITISGSNIYTLCYPIRCIYSHCRRLFRPHHTTNTIISVSTIRSSSPTIRVSTTSISRPLPSGCHRLFCCSVNRTHCISESGTAYSSQLGLFFLSRDFRNPEETRHHFYNATPFIFFSITETRRACDLLLSLSFVFYIKQRLPPSSSVDGGVAIAL